MRTKALSQDHGRCTLRTQDTTPASERQPVPAPYSSAYLAVRCPQCHQLRSRHLSGVCPVEVPLESADPALSFLPSVVTKPQHDIGLSADIDTFATDEVNGTDADEYAGGHGPRAGYVVPCESGTCALPTWGNDRECADLMWEDKHPSEVPPRGVYCPCACHGSEETA